MENMITNQEEFKENSAVAHVLEEINNAATYIETQPYVIPVNKKRDYTSLESGFAWLCFLFGFLFCKIFPVQSSPLGGFIFVVLIFLATTIVLKLNKAVFGAVSIATAISAVLMAGSLIFSSNKFLMTCAYGYSMMAYCYYIFTATGNATRKGFSDFLVVDYYKAMFVAPFINAGNVINGMFSGKAKRSGYVIGKVIKGGLIAFVPTIIVCGLLSYDRGFSRIISNMFDFDGGNIISNIMSLLVGLLVGQYLFRLFIASVDKECEGKCTADSCEAAVKKLQRAHVATIFAAILPILFLYVVFFISQWGYYMSGFSGKLPAGFNYAGYAREGFFQLCIVSVINLMIIVFVELFMDSSKPWLTKVKKSIVITYSVVTLVLIATAIAKMAMYIDCYGLTPKRVYATWLMAVLVMVFLVIIVKQFITKFNAVAASLGVFVTMFGLLALSNVDGFIVRYNVGRYLEGSLDTVDVFTMAELGDAAVPELVYLMEELETRGASYEASGANKIYERTVSAMEEVALDYVNNPRGVMAYNLTYYKAINSLYDAGLMEKYK